MTSEAVCGPGMCLVFPAGDELTFSQVCPSVGPVCALSVLYWAGEELTFSQVCPRRAPPGEITSTMADRLARPRAHNIAAKVKGQRARQMVQQLLDAANLTSLPVCNATYRKRGGEARRKTCRLPAIVAAGASSATRLPVVWSRELVQAQSEFVSESPFATSKFSSFMAQLPANASVSSVLGCRAAVCESCAVVGASGTLLSHDDGKRIDAHEVVIRPNWLILRAYERHVGTRTSLNIIFALENMVDQFVRSQRKLPVAQRATGLATPSKRSISSYFRYMGRLKKNVTHKYHRQRTGDAPLLLLSDSMYLAAISALCRATGEGCVWPTRSSSMRPSTGLYGVLVALHSCAKVSLFGLTSDPCAPFHYYGPNKTTCTLRVPKENDEPVHWFEKEHELYYEWQRQGRLQIHS